MKMLWQDESKCKVYLEVSSRDSRTKFEAGAPYFMFAHDWLRVIPIWIRVMPIMFTYYNGIESDMYAYMVACVYEGIDHVLGLHLMR